MIFDCKVCGKQVESTNHRDEGIFKDPYYDCNNCGSSYSYGFLQDRAEGEVCAFCGEFVEEIVEINLGGSSVERVCRECEEEHLG